MVLYFFSFCTHQICEKKVKKFFRHRKITLIIYSTYNEMDLNSWSRFSSNILMNPSFKVRPYMVQNKIKQIPLLTLNAYLNVSPKLCHIYSPLPRTSRTDYRVSNMDVVDYDFEVKLKIFCFFWFQSNWTPCWWI